jgi:RNA polymerase sigma-70 factor (ECF subfamily)
VEALNAEQVVARMAGAVRTGASPMELQRAADDVNALFAAHYERIYALCLRLMRDPERAREMTQEALLAAYQNLPRFRGDAKFSTWLFRIARNKCFRALRARRELLAEDGVIDPTDPSVTVLTRLRREEKEELLRQASVAVLEPLEQEAVYLRYTERLSIDRITALLDLQTASGSRGLLQRCRRKLGRELRRRLEEMGHGSSFIRGTW